MLLYLDLFILSITITDNYSAFINATSLLNRYFYLTTSDYHKLPHATFPW